MKKIVNNSAVGIAAESVSREPFIQGTCYQMV